MTIWKYREESGRGSDIEAEVDLEVVITILRRHDNKGGMTKKCY
jgi:hypothetical protein